MIGWVWEFSLNEHACVRACVCVCVRVCACVCEEAQRKEQDRLREEELNYVIIRNCRVIVVGRAERKVQMSRAPTKQR